MMRWREKKETTESLTTINKQNFHERTQFFLVGEVVSFSYRRTMSTCLCVCICVGKSTRSFFLLILIFKLTFLKNIAMLATKKVNYASWIWLLHALALFELFGDIVAFYFDLSIQRFNEIKIQVRKRFLFFLFFFCCCWRLNRIKRTDSRYVFVGYVYRLSLDLLLFKAFFRLSHFLSFSLRLTLTILCSNVFVCARAFAWICVCVLIFDAIQTQCANKQSTHRYAEWERIALDTSSTAATQLRESMTHST